MSAELPRTVDDLKTVTENVRPAAEAALGAGGGLLRLAPLVYLGEISYSVYMIHFPLQVVLHLMTVAGWIALDYANPGVLAAFLLLTVGAASLSYHFLELPAQRGINRRWDRRLVRAKN